MRKCIVVVHPKANCAPQFQMLNKNNKGLAFASWAGFGRINNVLQEYKKLKFLYLSSELGEALNLGVKLDHLKKTNHSKTTVEHCLYPPGSIYAVKWSLNLRCNLIMILRDIPGKIKALVNLNKSRYQPKKIIILK